MTSYHPHVDDLLPYMPESVKQAQVAFGGDPGVVGFCPELNAWIKKSTIPFVEHWRNALVAWTLRELGNALPQQAMLADVAREQYANAPKGEIRYVASIHPKIKLWMETVHGKDTWRDPESIADTRAQHPKLFVN